jgi:phospholipid:diacylglycerol acyltransferase
MIPGVISTGLESWGTEDEESRSYFRKRLWGSWTMMRALVLDQAEWKRKIMLDKHTGLDPEGVKLRAAQGFDAADFFITGYWIWNKILENLATIGYDPSNAFTAAYDWRLSYGDLETRDAYFTRLKAHIELAVRLSGKKVVLLSHSMGSQVLFYFFHWVEASGPGYGNGGENWVEAFVESWINISGCMLGAIKGIPAVLSGEMKDTAQLNAFALYGLEKFLSRHERSEIFRAMPGISSMLPMGGEAIWGNLSWAPDDRPDQKMSFGKMISFTEDVTRSSINPAIQPPDQQGAGDNSTGPPNHQHIAPAVLDVASAHEFLYNRTERWYVDQVQRSYSYGIAHTKEQVEENNKNNPRSWLNPLESRLPLAPNLKIYCFYGVGKPTERAYFYKRDPDPHSVGGVIVDNTLHQAEGSNATNPLLGDRTTEYGVVMGEGDGTVNLLSMGYMCNHGWRNIKRYNPAGAKITTFEMQHEPERFNPRGGPNTGKFLSRPPLDFVFKLTSYIGDHVDILGRSSLNDLILRVAGGKGELIEDNISSNILEYSKKVKIYDDNDPRNDVHRT